MNLSLQPARVELESWHVFPCFIDPSVNWNGYACPYFTKEVGLRIVDAMRQHGGEHEYDEAFDTFKFVGDFEPEIFDAVEVEGKKLYAIGAFAWCWIIVPPEVSDDEVALKYAADFESLDQSARLLQDYLKQDAGDAAGIFFSGRTEDDREWDEAWPDLSFSERKQKLTEYLAFERLYLN